MNGDKLTLIDKRSTQVNYIHDPLMHNFSAAKQVLPFLLNLKAVNSVLDVGCGTGTWLKIAADLGVTDILGIDGAELGQEDLKIPVDRYIQRDLTSKINLDRPFDLVLCLEVAEHLPEESAQELIDTLTAHSDFIVFAAAVPGQGGQNHLNEQWPAYWEAHFLKKHYFPCEILRDFFWNNEEVEWWYKQNILIFAPEAVLSNLNLSISKQVKSIIHPDLLKEKLEIIGIKDAFIENEIWNPKFMSTLKRLIKSIIS
jgi:2-polyprenyl-3-methyl-5-hydroxy-6-metoxy-1,4-benzoquinol methylase